MAGDILKDLKNILMNIDEQDLETVDAALNHFCAKSVVENGMEQTVFTDPVAAKKLNNRYRALTGKDHELFAKNIKQAVIDTVEGQETSGIEGEYTDEDKAKLVEQKTEYEKEADETEIENVVASDTILAETINSRVAEASKDEESLEVSENKEEVPVPDYLGMAGVALKNLFQKGVEKAEKWLPKAKDTINRGIDATVKTGITVGKTVSNKRDEIVATAKDISKSVKEAPDKIKTGIDNKIQEAQMAHARNVFTFRSQKKALFEALQTRINDLKEKGLDSLAENLEISKAYALCGLDIAREAKFKAQLKTEEIKGKVGVGIETAKGAIKTGAYTVGSKASELYENAKFAAQLAPSKIKSAKDRVIKGVTGFVKDMDAKLLEKQMAHARDKFDKRRDRQTFSAKAQDLVGGMKYRINELREKGKESFADAIEVSKAYLGVARDAVKPHTDKIVKKAKDAAEFVQIAYEDPKFAAEAAAYTLGQFTQGTVELGKEIADKGKEVLGKGIKGAKGFVEKVDKKILEAQMAHARDKFDKKRDRQTFSARVEDLVGGMKHRVNELRQRGKNNIADGIEVSKAYALVGLSALRDAKFKAQLKTEEIKGKVGVGIETAKGAIKTGAYTVGSKASEMYENAKFGAQLAKSRVIKSVTGFVKDMDAKLLEKQMAHARDKFDKRRDRQTFSAKAQDLIGGMKYRINELRGKGKEAFADSIEVSKAYTGVRKESIKSAAKSIVSSFNEGRENAKKSARKTAKGVVSTGVKGMANALGSATKVADKIHTGFEDRENTLSEIDKPAQEGPDF